MLRKILRITWVPVLLVLLYSGWLVWQRHSSRLPPPPVPQQADPLLAYGDRLKILDFYGTPAISRGEAALLCYSVVNAKSVRLDPPVEDVWPSLSRCFNVSPAKTTRYTFAAESAKASPLPDPLR